MLKIDMKHRAEVKLENWGPQHQANSKGKPEGRVIGDLSGQLDPSQWYHHKQRGFTTEDQALCRSIISGLCAWYVDDLMAQS